PVVYGAYPITPASDILHELSLHKRFRVRTIQAEDEIAAVGAIIGAAFGGAIGLCATSGPGLALKSEGIALAVMAELPIVVFDVQRGGPSTGLPTKTEQGDLLQEEATLARPWVKPGTPGLEHRIGGLEKQHITGNVSYDPDNHELMVKLRAEKVRRVAQEIPPTTISGPATGDLLVVGWGGTY